MQINHCRDSRQSRLQFNKQTLDEVGISCVSTRTRVGTGMLTLSINPKTSNFHSTQHLHQCNGFTREGTYIISTTQTTNTKVSSLQKFTEEVPATASFQALSYFEPESPDNKLQVLELESSHGSKSWRGLLISQCRSANLGFSTGARLALGGALQNSCRSGALASDVVNSICAALG